MWLVEDPCGRQYAVITQVLLLGANALLCGCVVWPSMGALAETWIIVHQISYVMTVWAHLACMLTDPGAVPWKSSAIDLHDLHSSVEASVEDVVRHCQVCQIVKPSRAHHCSTCERCILKMDHHCMFLNNCIGAYNHKHFLLFLLYLAIHCLSAALAIIASVTSCFYQLPSSAEAIEPHFGQVGQELELDGLFDSGLPALLPGPSDAASGVSGCWSNPAFQASAGVVGIVVFLAGRFSVQLILEQFVAVRDNQTGIERLKETRGETRSFRATLPEVMGGPISWQWLLPLPAKRLHSKALA